MLSQSYVVEQVAETLKKTDLSRNIVEIMQDSTEIVLNRIQQGINEQLKEDVAPIVQEFTQNLSKSLVDVADSLLKNNDKNLLPVFPVGTRLVKQSGDYLYIVVEEPPQCRNLFFIWEIPNGVCYKLGRGKVKNNSDTLSYYLSIPYTEFVLCFKGDKWNSLQVGFRAKPLEKITDSIGVSIFPNSSGTVCLGRDFYPKSQDISMVCKEVINQYWQGVFGVDYAENLYSHVSINNITLEEWEEKSKLDSLYSLKMKYFDGGTVLNFQSSNSELIVILKQHILKSVDQVGKKLQILLKGLDLSQENTFTVQSKEFQRNLKEIIIQAYSELWEYLSKNLNEERAGMKNEMDALKEKLKKEFMDWVKNSYKKVV